MKLIILFLFLWEQKVTYNINVELDTTQKILKGYEEITYRNNSPDILKNLYLHLYMNAYRNMNTYAFNESLKDYLISFAKILGKIFYKGGFIDIDSVKIKGKKIKFNINETILEIPLETPLLPGDSIELEIFFKTKLSSQIKHRMGFEDNHYDFGQFYPVMCVYDEKGWHNHRWHFNAEFYHNFSDYIVKIKVPGNFIVAGVGECISGNDTVKTEGVKEVVFKAENVIDYFFSCDPEFLYQDTLIDDTHIMAFYRKKHENYKDSFLIRTIRALEWLKELFGEYPYKWLKVVDGLIGGGMEYPGLALCGSDNFSLILHEVGHTYFMGILASNQEEEAWLDEGGTTFQTRYNKVKKENKLKLFYENTKNVIWMIREGFDDVLLTPSYAFKNNYYSVYSKGSHIYAMLLNIMGEEKFREFLKEYYRRFKFKHPTTDSLFKVAEEIYGKSLLFLKNIYVKGLPAPDFGIEKYKKYKAEDKWISEIKIKNYGNTFYPLDLFLLNKEDTFKIKTGLIRKDTILRIETEFEPKKIILDPYNFSLDIRRLNNYYPVNLERKLFFKHKSSDDALSLNYFPLIFYSPESHISPGFKLTFSYLYRYPYFSGEIYYSFKRKDIYYNLFFRYNFPFIKWENSISVNASGFEKNYVFNIGYEKKFQEYWRDPKTAYFLTEFVYKNSKLRTNFFDDANYAGFNFGFVLFPAIDLFRNSIKAFISIYPQRLSGDNNFRKFFIKYDLSLAPFYRFGISRNFSDLFNLKLFYGRIQGNFPKQEYFNNYSISSYGILNSFPERNFLLSGDYTFIMDKGVYLKGYKFVSFRDVFSLYLSTGIKVFGLFYEKILWGDYNLWDAGLYIKKYFSRQRIDLKIYLPLFINNPEFNGEKRSFDLRIKIMLKLYD